jgi:hypothetical protein
VPCWFLEVKLLWQFGRKMREGCKKPHSLSSSLGALLTAQPWRGGQPDSDHYYTYIQHSKTPSHTSLANQGVCWVQGEEAWPRRSCHGALGLLQLPCQHHTKRGRAGCKLRDVTKPGVRKETN